MFVKIFLIQKSKSSTNLNHKEGKQEETTIDQSNKISDSLKKISRVYFILGTIFLWDSFLLDHLSEGQLCRRQIIRKAIFLGGNFQVNIVRDQLSLG